jgi:Phage capsid family
MSPMSNAEKQARYRERRRALAETDDVTSLTRAVIAAGLSKLDRSLPSEVIRAQWADAKAELILRNATSPATLASSPALTRVAVAFLDTLVPMSAGSDLLRRGIGLRFDGAASITVPAIQVPTASFVAEGLPIPVVQAPTTPGPTLAPHKLAVITVLTRELLSSSNAETLVRQVLVESTGPALDAALFSANPATPNAPAGLLNGISPLTPAGAGASKGEVLVDDLQKIASAVSSVAGNGNIVIVASPDAAVALVLRLPQSLGWPVLISSSLPARTVIAVAANAIISAVEGAPAVDAATQPTIVYDTAPTPVDDAMTPATQFVGSLFQSDTVGLRLRWPISWTLRTPNAVAWMQSVNW